MLNTDSIPDFIKSILPSNSHIPNQYFPQLMGICGINPLVMCVSSVRNQMFGNHLGQALVISGATEARLQSGLENEYGKYTFSVKMPCDGKVIRVFQRYKQTIGIDSFKMSPTTTVMYESDDTREICLLEIPSHASYHQHFGFRFKANSGMALLYEGSYIKEGTVFVDSPNKTEHGAYCLGVEANIAFVSHPAVAEDGVVISESFAQRMKYYTYERRMVTFNPEEEVPLLIHPGDKIFPEIGDYTLPNGLLMAFRSFDPELILCNMDEASLREVDYQFDRRLYAGPRAGKVVDIRICFGGGKQYDTTSELTAQCMRYEGAARQYFKEIADEHRRIHAQKKGHVDIDHNLSRALIEGYSVNGFYENSNSRQVTIPAKKYKGAAIRGWQIEFVVEYENIPGKGNKVSGLQGDKGVIVERYPDEMMPIDMDGNRCEVMMDELSTWNRMNPARLYTQFINSCSRDLGIRLREICTGQRIGIGYGRYFGPSITIGEFLSIDVNKRMAALDLLLKYYGVTSQAQLDATMVLDLDGQMEHLRYVLINGVTIRRPTDTQKEIPDVVAELRDNPHLFPQTYGPIKFLVDGEEVITRTPIRIGTMHMLLLEKTGDDYSAVNSAKTNRFGVIGKQSAGEKFTTPVKLSSVRVMGEAEVRLFVAFVGEEVTVEIHDRNNNQITAKAVIRSILSSPSPTNIWSCVDRNLIKLGCSRPLQHFNHVTQTKGWTLEYLPQP